MPAAVVQFRIVSSSDLRPDIPGYRKRTIFPKTRAGCGACKAKKVKCDEGKPTCLRCQRNHRQCRYARPSDQSSRLAPTIPQGLLFGYENSSTATSGRQLLHHCRTYWHEIFPGFYQNDNFLMAFKSSELVRATCHAMAASHLRHLLPNTRGHIMAEYCQRALAMELYRKEITFSARELGQTGVNAMLLGATLFSLLNFPLPSTTDATSPFTTSSSGPWISEDHDLELGWLTFQAGLGPLMRSVLLYLPRAFEFLSTIFTPDHGSMWRNIALSPPPVPRLWLKFFQLEDDDACAQLPYPSPISSSSFSPVSTTSASTCDRPSLAGSVRLLMRMTAYLRGLEPTPTNSVLYLAFMFKAQRDFRTLLAQEHPRAWWLYGYWAGMMCRFSDCWWSRQRCERQYVTARDWLSKVDLEKSDPEWGCEDGTREMWEGMLSELDAAVSWPLKDVEMVVPEWDGDV